MLISLSFCSNDRRSPSNQICVELLQFLHAVRGLRPTRRLTKLDPYALYIDTPETEYVQTTDNYAWAKALHGSAGTEIDNTILCTVDNCCGSACRKCLPYILFESNENPILLRRAINRSTTSKARMLQKAKDIRPWIWKSNCIQKAEIIKNSPTQSALDNTLTTYSRTDSTARTQR